MFNAWKSGICVCVGILAFSTLAQASLLSYTPGGARLVYQDYGNSTGLTWTADANLAATQTFGVSGINANGTMTWAVANNWIAAMNTANYGGASDWRLWSALNLNGSRPTWGYNVDSELGHLFYMEGNLTFSQSILATPTGYSSSILDDYFANMKSNFYWSGTEYAPGSVDVWRFDAGFGTQNSIGKGHQFYAWAVRSGQVTSAVPLPATGWLMVSALMLLGPVGWRRRRSSLACSVATLAQNR